MKKNSVSKIIYFIFILLVILMVICLPILPKLYDIFKDKSIKLFSEHNIIYKVAFYLCYIICISIIYKLIGLFKSINNESPFNKKVESSLFICSILFIVLFIIVTIKSFFIPTILSFGVSLVCLIASLSFYVLREVIKVAINYKNEVDQTI